MTSTYSRENLTSLPTDDDDLTTAFASPGDYNAVALNDGTTVDQQGTAGYAAFEWKETATGNNGTFTWKGKSTKAPSESKVQLQIYKRTGTGAPVWEDVPDASDNSTAADTNFTISGTVSDLTNYKADITNEVALRTYQAAVAPAAGSVGRWLFENNLDDSSGLSQTLTGVNTPTFGTTSPPQGTYYLILDDALDQYLYCGDASLGADSPFKSGGASAGVGTVCFWFYITNATPASWSGIVGKPNWGGNNGFGIVMNAARTFCIMDSGAHGTGFTPDASKWYHVGITFNEPTHAWTVRYYDGTSSYSFSDTTLTGTFDVTTSVFRVGAYTDLDTEKTFPGYIDELVIFNTVLSDADIDKVQSGSYF